MPENQPPENDPFADLYGRLPDPRTGARPSAASAPDGAEGEPLSPRRAAREARRAATGPTATSAADSSASETSALGDSTVGDTAAPSSPAPAAGAPAAAARPVDAPRSAVGDDASRPAAGDAPAPLPAVAAARDDVSAPRAEAPRPTAAAEPPVTRRFDAARRADAPVATPRSTESSRRASTDVPAARRPDAARRAETPRTTEPSRDREPALVGAGVGASAASASRGPVASGSLEELFTGETTTHDIGSPPPRPPKKRRRIGGWIALGVVLLLLAGIVGGGFALWNTYGTRVQAFFGTSEPIEFDAGQATGEARITIVAGDTGESVSPKLFDAGITKASNSLYKYMLDNSVVFTFQPGIYQLQQQMTSEAVLTALRDPANRLDNSVQLREGLTLNQSLDLISEQIGIPREELTAAAADPSQYGVPAGTLEGWIFPATYDFDEGVTAKDVITRMVQRTIQSLDAAGVPEADRERILTVASIIEREARSSEDFYKVSRVIENRLQPTNQETFGKLEMDSTVQYGAGEMGSGSVSTSTEARNSDNPWNTYMYPGLPVGPIANPGDLAIDAAMKPADGPWLYFVTVNLDTGETVFTSTYSEHEKAVAQWQAWCAANPDGGC
ncbi:Endolytic murein transglycosylase [Microbacterium sp. MM2322]|uniref:endolytic transglycosylase MltG n=1 Tax=Microbacterium sp. MM2322 TaxID=3157631 RepID=UPI003D807982